MELIDIYTEDEKYVGVADRDVAHAFGLWHRTVHCWVVLADGRVVFQRRSKNRADNPDKLYTTASGHLSAGDTCEAALMREVAEEVGIIPCDPTLLRKTSWISDFKRKDGSDFHDRVVAAIYSCRYDGALDTFKFQDGEVDGVVAVDIDDFLALAESRVGSIPATEYDGRELKKVSVGKEDFLLTGNETLENKYALNFRRIKELF